MARRRVHLSVGPVVLQFSLVQYSSKSIDLISDMDAGSKKSSNRVTLTFHVLLNMILADSDGALDGCNEGCIEGCDEGLDGCDDGCVVGRRDG